MLLRHFYAVDITCNTYMYIKTLLQVVRVKCYLGVMFWYPAFIVEDLLSHLKWRFAIFPRLKNQTEFSTVHHTHNSSSETEQNSTHLGPIYHHSLATYIHQSFSVWGPSIAIHVYIHVCQSFSIWGPTIHVHVCVLWSNYSSENTLNLEFLPKLKIYSYVFLLCIVSILYTCTCTCTCMHIFLFMYTCICIM